MAEVWRVCREEGGVFRSVYANTMHCKAIGVDLEYPLGVETHAPRGTVGIFCFEKREDAEWLAGDTIYCGDATGECRELAVLRCLTPHPPEPIHWVFAVGQTSVWLRGRELLLEGRAISAGIATPTGTVVVPSLTAVERVWEVDDD